MLYAVGGVLYHPCTVIALETAKLGDCLTVDTVHKTKSAISDSGIRQGDLIPNS